MQDLIIHNRWALGDTVCLSALVRDIHRAYPDTYRLHMSGHYRNVFWRNNPNCEVQTGKVTGMRYEPRYLDGIKAAGRGSKKHFLSWFHEDCQRQIGLTVPVTEPKGDIHLSKDEKANRIIPYRYWLVVAGGKMDMTAKVWLTSRYQGVVDTLAYHGVRCVQPGAEFNKHFHPKLERCENTIGRTNSERDLFSLVYHCEGVICGITSYMHIAAVFDKPCVVVAGGREEPVWEAYSNCYQPDAFGRACKPVKMEHTFLHTVGLYDCKSTNNGTKGCWKDRTVAIDKGDTVHQKRRNQLCERPVRTGPQTVPSCMVDITVDHVVEAVMNYYGNGFLPPIGKPTRKYSLPVVGTPKGEADSIKELWDASVKAATPIDPDAEKKRAEIRGIRLVDANGNPIEMPLPAKEYMLEWYAYEQHGIAPLHPYVLEGGTVTEHSVDHSTVPPTEHVQITYPEGWLKTLPKEYVPAAGEDADLAILDHPYIGGKFTIFVLLYGDHFDLAKRCLESIINNAPANRIDLRVAMNQPSDQVLEYVLGFKEGTITHDYIDQRDRLKYPAMREMFHDPRCPITTKYLLWFDDDSWVIDKKWLSLLGREIVANHPHGARLFGPRYVHDLKPLQRPGHDPTAWFREAPWWTGQQLKVKGGAREAPNGHLIEFASGGFWALHVKTMKQAGIPDARLVHNGGDITIGEMVHQAGGKVRDFSPRPHKTPVRWSDAEPRGASVKPDQGKRFPWSPPA